MALKPPGKPGAARSGWVLAGAKKVRMEMPTAHCIRSRQVKTREHHRCWGCERLFPPGTMLEANTCVDAGEIETTYWCPVCLEVIDNDLADGYDYGQIRDGDRALWEETRARMEGEI